MRNGTFRISHYHNYEIVERGKLRHIQAIPLRDRIALNALMNEIERRLLPSFITDTGSSIKGRGGLFIHRRVQKAMRENNRLRWFYKADIRKYYESIDQELLVAIIHKKFREAQVQAILEDCVRMLPKGISIGLRSSQTFGNLLLSMYLDHVIKDGLGVKYYWRYCDDIVIGAEDSHTLTPIIKRVHECAARAGLEIKTNEQVFCIDSRPLDFLGYVTYGDGKIVIRKHIKQRFARRWRTVKSRTRRRELIGSFYGIAKHAHTKHLFKTITGYNMKYFADLGINYVAADGKKRFECPTVRLDDLQNVRIVVKDFETGITTKEGTNRYVVLVEDDGGVEHKFFTNSEEMKQILDKVRAASELPFRTVIKRKNFGEGKKKYCFT
ncbi:MAG: RNA-directed DNA polymerase [Bacteroidales bacterium]|nr:RNA-directed DNA polymerase [Bacteroidales bacterium]